MNRRAALLVLLAASIATGGPTGPLSVPAASQAELDKVLAMSWAKIKPELDGLLAAQVKNLANTKQGALQIDSLALTKNDTSSPPRVTITPIVTGQKKFLFFKWGTPKYDGEKVTLELPASEWNLELDGHVQYDLKVLFVKKHLSEDVKLTVSGLKATEELEFDTTDPAWPRVKKVGDLKLDYSLKVKTSSTLINIVTFIFKPIIDIIVRKQIEKALEKVDQQVGVLVGLPSLTPWGTGGPARPAFSQQPDLEKAALATSAEIQKSHLPWGTLLTTIFDQPGYGQGQIDHYTDFGDSAIWTGHYLAGECFRYAVTKDPAAQANAAKTIAAIQDLLDVEEPGSGHLARCFVPENHKDAPNLAKDPSAFTAKLRGVTYVCLDHISRDQYLGVMHGLGTAYDLLDDPAAKQQAGQLITRVVDYLVANSWVAMKHDKVSQSAVFGQSPGKMIMFSALAARVNPAKYGALRNELGQLAYMKWVFEFTGTLDPLSSYYKWNLGMGSAYHELRLETDPGRFMALERAHAMVRRAIGHHENAYFQTIDAAVDPALSATLAPAIEDELRRFASRDRRETTQLNSQDPAVQKDYYEVPFSYQKTATAGTLVPKKSLEAKYPIAVDKRTPTDFLWQRSPFGLDGQGDPNKQNPGVDLVLPYWMARHYKLVK
ncbi:MAG: hypothetical protein ACAI25_05025 [Planctomycetota bacterium]